MSRGDVVLVPGLAPASCAGAAAAVGAEVRSGPVDGFDPTPEVLAAAAEGSAAAVIARHHLGYPASLSALAEACSKGGAILIEDCRDALGALEPGEPLGTLGAAAILSFSSRRLVSCGEGGAVLSADGELAERVRSLRSHAMTSGSWDRHRGHAETYDVIDVGFNYRIDEIRASMCEAALGALDERVAERRSMALGMAAIGAELGATVPSRELIERSSPEAVPMLADADAGRESLLRALSGRGIAARSVGDDRLVVAEL